jgi:Flp pilus assembly CpaF family ATPase
MRGEQASNPALGPIIEYLNPIRDLILADGVSEVQIVNSCQVFTERDGVQRLEPVRLDHEGVYAALKRIAHECQQEIDAGTWCLD